MTTRTWHVDDALLQAYVEGEVDALQGASVEQHVSRCSACRARVRPLADLPGLDRAWEDVRTTVERPELPLAVRLAARLGLREPHAVLLAATVSLRTAWLSSALVALAFAAATASLTSGATSQAQVWPFLLVAPLVPVLGVAAAFDAEDEPFESLVATTPVGRSRLILLRTAAVLVTCLPVACLVGLLLPGPAWLAAAWLGPALCLVPVLFAVSSFTGPRVAGSVVALGWSGVVLGSLRPLRLGPTWPVEPTQQLCWLLLAVLALVVLGLRGRGRQIGELL